MKITVTREHEIACGHRVFGHENKCQHLHGHNYLFRFTCEADQLDSIGRVIDFSAIKERLCMWLEENWDHKFLVWERDSLMAAIVRSVREQNLSKASAQEVEKYKAQVVAPLLRSLVWVPFNPTAEHMAHYMVEVVGPEQLHGTGVRLVACNVQETRKCSAEASLDET